MRADAVRDTIDILFGSPINVISDCLRGFIIPREGYDFVAADFSAVESRVLNWLAGQEDILSIYRTDGRIYELNAAGIYNVAIDCVSESQRLIGKIAELALGFGGGKGAFHQMAKGYGVKVSDAEADSIKTAWRANHPKVVYYWHALERAAVSAVLNPGEKYQAGAPGRRVTYLKNGSFLLCQLPSGRVMTYPYPKIEVITTPWGGNKDGLTTMGVDGFTGKFERHKAWGGLLAENTTSAVSRDLLVSAMQRLEMHNYAVTLHIHDEIVCEVPEGFGSVTEMENIMAESPRWAAGLPIAAKGWRGKRFRK